MSEGLGGVQPQTLIADADADPLTSPTSPEPSTQPEQSATPNVQPGAIGGGVASAGDTKALETGAQKVIAAGAKIAGLGELKSDGSHQGNVVNATKVFVELTKLAKTDPAMKGEVTKFLKELASAGKGIYNWGLKLDGVPLNQLNTFKGVDAAQSNSQPQGDSTSKTTAGATEGGGKGLSPDDVRAAVTPMLEKVATLDKNGDPKVISLADLDEAGKSADQDPRLLALVKTQVEKGGDMTVAAAVDHVVKFAVASQQGGTQQTQAQQGEQKTTQPEQKTQQGQLDLTKLDVKQFIANVNTDPKDGITRAEMEAAKGSDTIDATGKQLLELLLSKMPPTGNPATDPKKLESLLLSAQQKQLQGGADVAQGAR